MLDTIQTIAIKTLFCVICEDNMNFFVPHLTTESHSSNMDTLA